MKLTTPMQDFLHKLYSADKSIRKPALRLIFILNQYHSIGIMSGTSEQKEVFETVLSKEAELAARYLPTHIQSQLPFWIDSKELWDEGRERIYF